MATPITLQLTIEDLTSEGQGVARKGRDVYFVDGALPGEQVTVQLNGRRKKVWQTRLLAIDLPSGQRVEPTCQHYHRCGGCDLQHLSYESQVAFKQGRVEREFNRQSLTVAEWAEPITAEPWHYRRKARLGVRYSKDKQQNFVGFREAASEHITNIDRCPVLPDLDVLDWASWRELLNRLQFRDRITQIEVIAADNALALVLRVLKPLPDNDRRLLQQWFSDAAACHQQELQLWLNHGREQTAECLFPQSPATLHHQVDGVPLRMQLTDFFQVNGSVNRRMVDQAIGWLDPAADECIWDLFAGHGNFSVPLARRCDHVVAVEGQDSMVDSLTEQAETLALSLHAIAADLSKDGALAGLPAPDKVLLDPPRAGAAALINELVQRRVKRLLYVSCDAATLARDLNQLCGAGYRIDRAGIMDMFPQTHHVETMALLSWQGK